MHIYTILYVIYRLYIYIYVYIFVSTPEHTATKSLQPTPSHVPTEQNSMVQESANNLTGLPTLNHILDLTSMTQLDGMIAAEGNTQTLKPG